MTKAIQNQLGRAARTVTLAFVLLGISFMPARAVDDVQRIVVVVNDAVVSEFDIRERIGLVMATTGQVSSEEQLELMRENVREMLIDEILQLQEALEKELTFTEAEVEERYAQLAASNNVSVSQFDNTLEQMGASKSTILSQMRASVAWEQVVDSQLRPFLAIAESEVDNYKNRMVANKGEPEYRLAEIFVTVPSADRASEAQATANQLAEQIREGGPCCIVIPPSGTRGYTDYWKSGFYWIAREADIPVVCTYLDYPSKTACIGPSFHLCGEVTQDMDKIRSFYAGITGKIPANQSQIRLREEQ